MSTLFIVVRRVSHGVFECLNPDVLYTVTRARRGVGLTPGITVIGAPRAAVAAVMPGVRRTPGRVHKDEARGVGPPPPSQTNHANKNLHTNPTH